MTRAYSSDVRAVLSWARAVRRRSVASVRDSAALPPARAWARTSIPARLPPSRTTQRLASASASRPDDGR
ncbi:hypothetical protein E4N62_17355 [Streptomyces sp. MNU76]|uniref:hypothetical protein n=1 Tax=Streptomyces sp. MNU76 TaxID=2560026 RepID=UPI001E33257E|nr:hypothetical protein [Streptomyces sp. MNU76]MCC9706880.1 hypothetical protein [Streptomyces sp. MNU76]